MSSKTNSESTQLTSEEKAALRQIGKFFLLFFGTKLAFFLLLRKVAKMAAEDLES